MSPKVRTTRHDTTRRVKGKTTSFYAAGGGRDNRLAWATDIIITARHGTARNGRSRHINAHLIDINYYFTMVVLSIVPVGLLVVL